MESQILHVPPKTEVKEALCSATLAESSERNHSTMETHIQNICVKEVTDLLAQGDPVSFVIVGDREDALDWIQNSEIVLGSQNIRHQENEKVIVLETGSNVQTSETCETTLTISTEESPADTSDSDRHELETRKRSHTTFLPGQPMPKVIKMSKEEVLNKSCVETKAHDLGNSRIVLCKVEPDEKPKSATCSESGEKTVYFSQSNLSKNVFSQEPHKIKVIQEGPTVNVINVYNATSDSTSLSSAEGSMTNFTIKKEHTSSDHSVPLHQQVAMASAPTVVKVADALQMTQLFSSADSGMDYQTITVSSPGAHVELTVNGDSADGFQEESRQSKESQKVVKVGGLNLTTGLAEGGVVYRCGECDYASSNKHYYKQHVDLVHNTARPFKCPFCDYAGKRGHALREHLIVHSAQRPYSCLHCNATFRKKGHLTNHTKLHATSAGSTGLPGGLAGGAGAVKVTGTAADISLGKFEKIPISMDGSSPIITVTAEPSGHLTAVLPPSQTERHQPGVSGMAKRSQLWCALCAKEMVDAAFFQTHLKTVHGTDRLFACDRCEYVTANKGAILSHLALHIPANVTAETHPVTAPAPSTSPSTPPPLYVCTYCGFATKKMDVLVSHAATHNLQAGSNSSAPVVSKTPPQPPRPQQPQMSKVICSECGHVADSTESMHAHLWTHIRIANAATEVKDKPTPPQQLQEQKSGSEATSSSTVEQVNSPCPVGLKTLPENAALKCTECSYVSRDASQFVKHMLVHKARQNQAPKIQVQSSSSGQGTVPENTTTVSKAGFSYKVKPITTENTCRNTDSSPFVHDASTGRFRCTICGYSCEYQRTIKAHIWKHSGHHQVDYPIFQNGPLSMYEDPVSTSSQPVSQQGKASTIQSPAGTASVRMEVKQLATSQPSSSDTSRTNLPLSTLSGNKPTSASIPVTSESAPLSVKFITVSGSQVLHSSGPLPSGNLKLIPVQSGPVTSPSVPSSEGKQVIVHVQGPQSESKPGSGVVLMKMDGPAVSVKSNESQQRESLSENKYNTVDNVPLKGGPSMESPPQSGGSVEIQPPLRSVSQTEANQTTVTTAVDSTGGRSDTADPVSAVVGEDCTTSASEPVSVNPVTSIASARHVLPMCATVDKQQSRVAVPLHSQPDNQTCPLPAMSDLNVEVTATSATETQPSASENHCRMSPAVQPKGNVQPKENVDNPVSSEAKTDLTDQTCSISNTENEMCFMEKAQSPEHDSGLKQKDSVNIEKVSSEGQEINIAGSMQRRRRSRNSATEQSVVVETVDTIFTPCSYTGLLSQQTSPRVSRSSNCSPVPAQVNQLQTPTVSQGQVETGQVEPSSRVLRSSKRRANVKEKSEADTPEVESARNDCYDNEKQTSNQSLQDSESAVTLLSLLKRGPNFNPACPPGTDPCVHSPKQNPPLESPDRSPSSSSETDSVVRETTMDGMSEDLSCEVESTSSGKNRAGGGICSTLLAVIEQLRERSRSESDAEDKQLQPPAKKRSGRRRGRQESQEEVLEVRDSDNIEQLSVEEGVNYRCKLCHYTSPRVPLIRLHMRTHRQKDPFECSLCSVVAESSEALQEHMIQHCKVRTYACKFCPQSFNHKSTLRAHMRAHNESEPFLCDLCDFECSNPLDYRAHMQKHAGSALLSCPHCPALVASRQDLRIHQAGICPASLPNPTPSKDRDATDRDSSCEETSQGEKIVCPKCEFTSTDRSRMDTHIAGHTDVPGIGMEVAGEGPLRCALCDFTAVSSRSLKSHMKRHANDQRYVQQPLEQYKCSLCGYVCHHLPSLKSHMWRHASDQNYSYQFTNDVINAAIDYDTRSDPPPQPSKTATTVSKEPDEPELLDRVLSAERKIVEGQMSRPGGSEPICWVTFRCCQCGFETINKAKLNLHMRTHADIIQRALKISSGSVAEGESVPSSTDSVDSDGMNIKVIYGPV